MKIDKKKTEVMLVSRQGTRAYKSLSGAVTVSVDEFVYLRTQVTEQERASEANFNKKNKLFTSSSIRLELR